MDFESKVIEYILQNTERDSEPKSITIEPPEESVWKTPEGEDILVEATWWVEKEHDDLFGDGQTTRTRPEREFFHPQSNDEIYDPIMAKFSEIQNQIKPLKQGVEISSLTISPAYDYEENSEFTAEWDDEITEEFTSMSMIDYESDIEEPEYALIREILDYIEETFDESLKTTDYDEIVLAFSDFYKCTLNTVKARVLTENPHKFYKEVDSLEEYCEQISDDEDEYEKLINQDEYEVLTRPDIKDGEINKEFIPDSIRQKAEDLMRNRINELVDVDTEFIPEAESIIINPDSTNTSFWVRTQFSHWD